MSETLTPVATRCVGSALVYLSGQCDGARTEDGHGFSRYDAETGRDLAAKFTRYGRFASEKQHAFAKRLALKYRRQLAAAGHDIEALAAETFTAPERAAPTERPAEPETVQRCIIIRKAGDRAYLAQVGTHREEWLPRSLVQITHEKVCPLRNGYKGGTFATVNNVVLPAWLARQKGILAPALPPEAFYSAPEGWEAAMKAMAAAEDAEVLAHYRRERAA